MFDYLRATLVNGTIQKSKRLRQLRSSRFEFLWLKSARRASWSEDRLFMWKRQQMDNQTSAGRITALEHSVFICLPPSVFLSGISGFIYPCRPPFFFFCRPALIIVQLCLPLFSSLSSNICLWMYTSVSVLLPFCPPCSRCCVRETQTQHVGTDPSGKWAAQNNRKRPDGSCVCGQWMLFTCVNFL